MWGLQGWELAFAAAVLGGGAVVLIYIEARRLLAAALDDRYGALERYWQRAGALPEARLGSRLRYGVTFFFCHGVHDLTRLGSLLAFDLFVMFALLSPFWRYAYFDDWSPAPAAGLALAGVAVYIAFKVRQGAALCRVHQFGDKTRRCERCDEPLLPPEHDHGRFWHGFWARRLERLNPPPAG